jgi:hypothetical protein
LRRYHIYSSIIQSAFKSEVLSSLKSHRFPLYKSVRDCWQQKSVQSCIQKMWWHLLTLFCINKIIYFHLLLHIYLRTSDLKADWIILEYIWYLRNHCLSPNCELDSHSRRVVLYATYCVLSLSVTCWRLMVLSCLLQQ